MWFPDSRGKPAKWMRAYRDELKAAIGLELCRAALAKLEASPEIFVMVAEPAIRPRVSLNTGTQLWTVVCRVRWMPDEATAERRLQFEAQMDEGLSAWAGEDGNRKAERF